MINYIDILEEAAHNFSVIEIRISNKSIKRLGIGLEPFGSASDINFDDPKSQNPLSQR